MDEMNNVTVENQETGLVERNVGGIQTYDLEPEEKTFPVGKYFLGGMVVGGLIYGGWKLWKRFNDKKSSIEDLEEYEDDDDERFFEVPAEGTAAKSKTKRK